MTWQRSRSLEALLERDREQEAGEDLRAGLHDAQLLQDLVPVAVEPLGLGLVPAVAGDGVVVSGHGGMLRRSERPDIVSR